MKSPRFAGTLVVALSLPSLFGCGSEESVTLTARVENPAATVRETPFLTVAGSFELVLALGAYAMEATAIDLGAFGLQQGGVDIAPALEFSDEDPAAAGLQSDGATFPVPLGVGGRLRIELSFVNDVDGTRDAICASDLAVLATIEQQGGDRPTRVASDTFLPICP